MVVRAVTSTRVIHGDEPRPHRSYDFQSVPTGTTQVIDGDEPWPHQRDGAPSTSRDPLDGSRRSGTSCELRRDPRCLAVASLKRVSQRRSTGGHLVIHGNEPWPH